MNNDENLNDYNIDADAEQISKDMIQKQIELFELSEKQLIISQYKNAVDKELVEFARNYADSDNSVFCKYEIGKVNERQAKDISALVGFDITNYKHVITSATVRHIEKRHGKNGLHDKSMQEPQDIARINYVLSNYDKVELSQKESGRFYNLDNTLAKSIVYTKRINGTFVVVEVSPNSNKHELLILTAYKIKAKEKTTEKQSPIVEEGKRYMPKPSTDVQNGLTTSSTTSIPQTQKKVNSTFKNNDKNLER